MARETLGASTKGPEAENVVAYPNLPDRVAKIFLCISQIRADLT